MGTKGRVLDSLLCQNGQEPNRSYLRGSRIGSTPAPVPTDHRMPFRNVRFPTEVTPVERDLIIGTEEFLAIPDKDINKAIRDFRLIPLLLQILGEEGGSKKGLHLPDDRLVVVSPFIHPRQIAGDEAPAPMSSPNGKHVYLDRDQWLNAVRHGAFKQRLLDAIQSAESNAGYNNSYPVPPAPSAHDQYFNRATR